MSYKNASHDVLMNYYDSHSLEQTLAVARAMLRSASYKDVKAFTSHVHGEICETVLEILVTDYVKNNPSKTEGWFMSKGLIIKDIENPNNGYFTELDYTVFTPQKIFAFECKSYGGDKRIIKQCTISKKKGGSFDVYAQHEKHARVLAKQLRPFRKSKYLERPAYQLALFDFSVGKTVDVRDPKDKIVMPCLNEKNVLNIFSIYENDPVIWNMPHLEKAIKIIERRHNNYAEKHLQYVQEVNKRRKK